jgi:hypothetical protein
MENNPHLNNTNAERIENDPISQIEKVKTFDELYSCLESMTDPIQGGHRTYTAEELIESIKQVVLGKAVSESITRTYGIRRKVEELVKKNDEKLEEEIPQKIEKNIIIMNEQMIQLLSEESVGGYGEFIMEGDKKILCGGTNGLVDKDTGIIAGFGNPEEQEMRNLRKKDTQKKLVEFTFRVAFKGKYSYIVAIHINDNLPNIKTVLRKSAYEWNRRKGVGTTDFGE